MNTKSMSTAARGLTAVTTETRLAAAPTSAPRFLVERRHEFALGEADEVGAVDDLAEMAFPARRVRARAAARRARTRAGRAPACAPASRSSLAMTADRALAQLLDRREPEKPDDFARDEDEQGESRRAPPARGRASQAIGAGKQVLDQTHDGEAEASETSPPSADQNSVPQGKLRRRTASARTAGPATHRSGFGRDDDRAAAPRRVSSRPAHPTTYRPADRRAGTPPACAGRGRRSCETVSQQELQRAVEANVRQGRRSVRSTVEQRRAKAQEAVVGLARGRWSSGPRKHRPARVEQRRRIVRQVAGEHRGLGLAVEGLAADALARAAACR